MSKVNVAIEDVLVKRSIIHILDSSLTTPQLSIGEMPMSIDTNEFFATHIAKTMNNESLNNLIIGEENGAIYKEIQNYKDDNFVEFSKKMASRLFSILSSNLTIPSGDLAVVKYRCRQVDYLALLKLNYRQTKTHRLTMDDINELIDYRTTLPSSSQSVTEAIVIDLEDFSVSVLDKKYDIQGEKKKYLTQVFFAMPSELSSKENFAKINQALTRVIKKFFDNDPEKVDELKKVLHDCIDVDGSLDLEEFANKAFAGQEEIRTLFMEYIEKKGVNTLIQFDPKTMDRMEKYVIKTTDGVKVELPINFVNDSNRFEYVIREDGNIDIVIKNVNKVV